MPHFGPAGVPRRCKSGDVVDGIEVVAELGLDLMELEFVRSVWIKDNEKGKKRAKQIREKAEELGVILTAHAPYFINLLSAEEKKIEASIQRIVDTARAADWTGATRVVVHLGYYGKLSKEEAYKKMKENLSRVLEEVKGRKYRTVISPETLGKKSQFGDLEEIVSLCEELGEMIPTVDFAHLHARTGGEYLTKERFLRDLEYIEERLGSEVLKQLHIHFSGIEYGERGERKHLPLEEADIDFRPLAEALCELGLEEVTIVSESPILEDDAIKMMEIYKEVCTKK